MLKRDKKDFSDQVVWFFRFNFRKSGSYLAVELLQNTLLFLAVCIGAFPSAAAEPNSHQKNSLLESNPSITSQPTVLDSIAPDQTPSASQFANITSTDWEYQALQSIAQRYDCTNRDLILPAEEKQQISRLEFATNLNACLTQIHDWLTSHSEHRLSKEDLVVLQRLREEFELNLLPIQGRVDAIEARISEVEAVEFSPTAQLNILSSFNLAHATAAGNILAEGGNPVPGIRPTARPAGRTEQLEPIVGTISDDPSITLSESTYLIFTFSRESDDLLTAILAMGNGNPPANTFSSAGLTSTFGVPFTDTNPVPPLDPNQVGLLELKYSFPVTPNLALTIGPRILPFRHFDANLYTDVIRGTSGLNFYQSTLANSGLTEAGAIVDWAINPVLTLRGGYLVRNDAAIARFYGSGNGPTDPNRGLFNGTNSIQMELTYSPNPNANIRLLYARYHLDAPPPGPFGQNYPFFLSSLRGVVDDGVGGGLNDVIQNSIVLNFDWLVSSKVALFGRYSYSVADIDPINPKIEDGTVNLQAFQLGMAFPDLGRDGALATLAAVIPFDVVSGREFLVAGGGDGGTEVDLSAIYSYPIDDHIDLIPSFFLTLNPNNFDENPLIYSTTLRLQFLF